jgi:hypothetical protein
VRAYPYSNSPQLSLNLTHLVSLNSFGATTSSPSSIIEGEYYELEDLTSSSNIISLLNIVSHHVGVLILYDVGVSLYPSTQDAFTTTILGYELVSMASHHARPQS